MIEFFSLLSQIGVAMFALFLKPVWNYPNNDFLSYGECDEKYMKDVLASFTPSNLLPIWLTNQLDTATSLLHMTDLGK